MFDFNDKKKRQKKLLRDRVRVNHYQISDQYELNFIIHRLNQKRGT